jgi:hypothetical protein
MENIINIIFASIYSCHGAGKYRGTWEYWGKVPEGVEGIVLQKGRDVGRCGESSEDGGEIISTIRKWFEVL